MSKYPTIRRTEVKYTLDLVSKEYAVNQFNPLVLPKHPVPRDALMKSYAKYWRTILELGFALYSERSYEHEETLFSYREKWQKMTDKEIENFFESDVFFNLPDMLQDCIVAVEKYYGTQDTILGADRALHDIMLEVFSVTDGLEAEFWRINYVIQKELYKNPNYTLSKNDIEKYKNNLKTSRNILAREYAIIDLMRCIADYLGNKEMKQNYLRVKTEGLQEFKNLTENTRLAELSVIQDIYRLLDMRGLPTLKRRKMFNEHYGERGFIYGRKNETELVIGNESAQAVKDMFFKLADEIEASYGN